MYTFSCNTLLITVFDWLDHREGSGHAVNDYLSIVSILCGQWTRTLIQSVSIALQYAADNVAIHLAVVDHDVFQGIQPDL